MEVENSEMVIRSGEWRVALKNIVAWSDSGIRISITSMVGMICLLDFIMG